MPEMIKQAEKYTLEINVFKTHFERQDEGAEMNMLSQHPHDKATTPELIGRGGSKPVVRATRWLVLGTIVGPVLFTLAWFVLGFLSPGYTAWGVHIAPYSAISQGISGLGLGITAPFMNTAFVFSGIVILVGVVGVFQAIGEMGALTRWICTILLALSPLGMIMDGIFTLESFFLHLLGFLLAAATPILSFVVIGLVFRRMPGLRRFGNWLLVASPLTLVLLILYFLTFSPTVAGTQTGVAGLTERILVIELHFWFVVMGWLILRRPARAF